MNAVKLFKSKMVGADLKRLMSDGVAEVKLGELTAQEKEDLSHLRLSNIGGVLFDDRETTIRTA